MQNLLKFALALVATLLLLNPNQAVAAEPEAGILAVPADGFGLFADEQDAASDVTEAVRWRCDAWPYYSYYSPFYYWISWNANYSARQAMSYCTYNHGNVCVYRCYAG